MWVLVIELRSSSLAEKFLSYGGIPLTLDSHSYTGDVLGELQSLWLHFICLWPVLKAHNMVGERAQSAKVLAASLMT